MTAAQRRSVVDEVVELERIDLAAVKLCEAVANVVKQVAQLLLVILTDDLAGSAPPRALGDSTAVITITAHLPNATPKRTILATERLHSAADTLRAT